MMGRYPVAYAAQVQGPYSMFTPTWRELRKRLTKPLDAPKSEAPVFVPAQLEGSRRAREHVKQVTLLVFDIDNKDKSNQITSDQMCERLMRQKLEAIVYSTPSHTHEDLRYRVVIRLSEPIPTAEFKRVANAAIDLLQLNAFVDKSAVEPSRCFYLPACTDLNVQDFESLVTRGEPLSPYDPRLQQKASPQKPVSPQVLGATNHPETTENVYLVKAMLEVIPADTDYKVYRQIIWSLVSLNWSCAESLATEWSRTSLNHWATENATSAQRTLDALIRSFDPNKGISAGTLIHTARQNGYSGRVLGQAPPLPMLVPFDTTTDSKEAAKGKSKYKLQDRADLMAEPPQTWLVKNVLPSRGLGCVFGQSGAAKTFLLLDLAAAICEGNDWFGFRTVQTPVVYLCLEGSSGLQKRVKAWEKANGREFPDNFHYLTEDFDLSIPTDVSALIDSAPNGAICIVDTLNRASPGSDENSSSDMGRLLAASKRIEQGIGGLVILCHHTGKDASKGLRGHSSLHAAIDGEIEVVRNKGLDTRAWRSSKLKDEKDGFDRGFRLVQHVLGADSDGDPVTSCTIEPTINIKVTPRPKGTQQGPAYDKIKSLLSGSEDYGQGGAPFAMKCVKVSKAKDEIAKILATVDSHKRSNRAKTLIDELSSKGFIRSGIDDESGDGWIWSNDQ